MEIYFFVIITFIIIGLLAFALCESKGRNSPSARNKLNKAKYQSETPSPTTPVQHSIELAPAPAQPNQ